MSITRAKINEEIATAIENLRVARILVSENRLERAEDEVSAAIAILGQAIQDIYAREKWIYS